MKIPNFLQKRSKDIWYWIKLRDDSKKVNKNDFYGIMTIPRVQRKLKALYDADPNSLNPREVSSVFGQVLRSMDVWNHKLSSV